MFKLDGLDDLIVLYNNKLTFPKDARASLQGYISELVDKRRLEFHTVWIAINDDPLVMELTDWHLNFFDWSEGDAFSWHATQGRITLCKQEPIA